MTGFLTSTFRTLTFKLSFIVLVWALCAIPASMAKEDIAKELNSLGATLKGNKCLEWDGAAKSLIQLGDKLFKGSETHASLDENQSKWLSAVEGFIGRKDLGGNKGITLDMNSFSKYGAISKNLSASYTYLSKRKKLPPFKMGAVVPLPFPEHYLRLHMLSHIHARKSLPDAIKTQLIKKSLDFFMIEEEYTMEGSLRLMLERHKAGLPLEDFHAALLRWFRNRKYPFNKTSVEGLHTIWPEDKEVQTWLSRKARDLHLKVKAKSGQ